MSTLIVVLRIVPLLAFAGSMVLSRRRPRGLEARARQPGSNRVPVLANSAALASYILALSMFSGSTIGLTALLLASSGALLGIAGAALIQRSRAALGPAWSFVATADRDTGLVTTGPYRLVRHPIYLGFILLATGEAVAFASWPAVAIVVCGLVPTFAWRARTEEALLSHVFGERYAEYRQRTTMIVPYLLTYIWYLA